MTTVITFARRVYTRTGAQGRVDAAYHDLVKLSTGKFAVTNPLAPGDRVDFIRQYLTEEQALAELRRWEHWPCNKPNGEHSSVWPDGRRWLRQVESAT